MPVAVTFLSRNPCVILRAVFQGLFENARVVSHCRKMNAKPVVVSEESRRVQRKISLRSPNLVHAQPAQRQAYHWPESSRDRWLSPGVWISNSHRGPVEKAGERSRDKLHEGNHARAYLAAFLGCMNFDIRKMLKGKSLTYKNQE